LIYFGAFGFIVAILGIASIEDERLTSRGKMVILNFYETGGI
jgi:hypothetical protein